MQQNAHIASLLQKTKETKDASEEVGRTLFHISADSGNSLPNLSEGTRLGPPFYPPPCDICPTNMDYASGPFRGPCKRAPRCWVGGTQAISDGLPGASINNPPPGQCTVHSNRFCKTSIWEGERDLVIGYQECTLSLLAWIQVTGLQI